MCRPCEALKPELRALGTALERVVGERERKEKLTSKPGRPHSTVEIGVLECLGVGVCGGRKVRVTVNGASLRWFVVGCLG